MRALLIAVLMLTLAGPVAAAEPMPPLSGPEEPRVEPKLGEDGIYHQDWFVQALEGDEATVRGLYEHIYRDDRHERVSVIETGTVEARVFGRWSMAKVSDDGESDIPLLMNVDKGGISPAAPRPTTPEQESVLEFMRNSVRGGATVG